MLIHTLALRRTLATLSAAGALTTLGLAPAAAHEEVLSTFPEQGAVLESAPEQIELSYSGEIMDIGHQVLVTDSEGQSVTDGPLKRDGSQVIQPLTDTDAQDETYQVVWRVVSSDGHPIEGTYTYDVGDGAETTAPAPSPSSTPTEAPAENGADGSAQTQDAAAQENSGGFSGWAIAAAAVVLALAVVGFLGVVSRRRRRS